MVAQDTLNVLVGVQIPARQFDRVVPGSSPGQSSLRYNVAKEKAMKGSKNAQTRYTSFPSKLNCL